MTLSDRIFLPFERLIKPFELPLTVLPDKGPMRLVWHFVKMFRGVLAVVGVLSVVSTLIGIAVVWTLAFVVDGVVEKGAALFVSDHFWALIGFAFLLLVIDPLTRFLNDCFGMQTLGALLPASMKWQAHKSVEKQDISFFEDLYAGQVASRIGQVTGSVQRQIYLAISQIPRFVMQFVGALALLLVLAWPLAVPVFVWMVFNAFLAYKLHPFYRQKSEKLARASSRLDGAITDVYSNIHMVKAFSAETSEGDAIREVMQESIDTRQQQTRFFIMADIAVRFSNAVLAVLIFGIGMWGLTAGFVSIGDFVAAVTVSRILFDSAFAFIDLSQSVSEALGTIKDAMPVITTKPKLGDAPDAKPFRYERGDIEFDNVSYAYDEGKRDEDQSDDEDQEEKAAPIKRVSRH